MAFFRRNPADQSQWLVVDLPDDAQVGSKITVDKKGGVSTAVTIASILTMDDGTRAATIARKRKARAVTCPNCEHAFEA